MIFVFWRWNIYIDTERERLDPVLFVSLPMEGSKLMSNPADLENEEKWLGKLYAGFMKHAQRQTLEQTWSYEGTHIFEEATWWMILH